MSKVRQLDVEGSKPNRRADARRNRERVLEAAKACFADDTKIHNMEDIARRAGVGVGTLYRAFGNQSGLAEAVYRDMLDELAQSAAELSKDPRPWHALRGWLEAYVEQLIAKRAIMRELQPLFEQKAHLTEETWKLAAEALDVNLSRAKDAKLVRADAHSSDILQLVNGTVRVGSNDPDRIAAMLKIVLEGIRDHAAGAIGC